MCCCQSWPRFPTARARSKGLAKPYYAGTGKGLKPETDNAVAVVAAAAVIAVAVIAVPIVAAVRMGQVIVTKNGLAKGIPVLLDLELIATICTRTSLNPSPSAQTEQKGLGL